MNLNKGQKQLQAFFKMIQCPNDAVRYVDAHAQLSLQKNGKESPFSDHLADIHSIALAPSLPHHDAEGMIIKTPTLMSGMQLIGHGDLDKLMLRDDIVVPTPGPTDVLIKVRAAGVNNTDLNTRLGWYSKSDGAQDDASWSGQAIAFPRIQGADVCGIVVACGQEVDTSLLQQRVIIEPCITEAAGNRLETAWYFGSECDGGFAEYTVVAAKHAYPIISDLSDVELPLFPALIPPRRTFSPELKSQRTIQF